MRLGIILFVSLYLGLVAALAALLTLKVRGMKAGRVALWVGGAIPATLLIVIIAMLLSLIFGAYPRGPEGNFFAVAIWSFLLMLDGVCLIGGLIVAWIVAKVLSGSR